MNIPITLYVTDSILPICEYLAKTGISGRQLVASALKIIAQKEADLDFLCTYIHPHIEGIELFAEFSQLIQKLSQRYALNRTFSNLLA